LPSPPKSVLNFWLTFLPLEKGLHFMGAIWWLGL
jgi:hypothetical protein